MLYSVMREVSNASAGSVHIVYENYDLAADITSTTPSVNSELSQQNAELTAQLEALKNGGE